MIGDSTTLYRITKDLGQKNFTAGEGNLTNKVGQSITTEIGKINRWQEYFKELLKRPIPDVVMNGIEAGYATLEVDTTNKQT